MHVVSDMIGQRTRAPKSSEGKMVSGKETLRLRSKGPSTVQEVVSFLSGWHGENKYMNDLNTTDIPLLYCMSLIFLLSAQ